MLKAIRQETQLNFLKRSTNLKIVSSYSPSLKEHENNAGCLIKIKRRRNQGRYEILNLEDWFWLYFITLIVEDIENEGIWKYFTAQLKTWGKLKTNLI